MMMMWVSSVWRVGGKKSEIEGRIEWRCAPGSVIRSRSFDMFTCSPSLRVVSKMISLSLFVIVMMCVSVIWYMKGSYKA